MNENTIAFFQFSTEEDLRFQLDFTGISLAGRDLRVDVRERATNLLKVSLVAPNLAVVGTTTLIAGYAKSTMASWATGEYEADLIDETGDAFTRIVAVRFVYDHPGKLVYGVRGNQATIAWSPNQAIVTAIGGVGPPGATGPANTLTIGTVTTLGNGVPATAALTGTAPNQTLALGLPRGDQGITGSTGADGPANTLTIGTVTTLGPGVPATASVTGTAPNQTLALGLPRGDAGAAGAAGATGATGPAGPTMIFSTRAAFIAATIPVGIDRVQLQGRTTATDGGGAIFNRLASAPPATYPEDIQITAGSYWRMAPGDYNARAFGALGDGTNDDSIAMNALFDAVRRNGPTSVFSPAPPVNYFYRSSLNVSAMSNMIWTDAPGTKHILSSDFDGSDPTTKNNFINGLNFTGTAGPLGHDYRNIIINLQDVDLSAQSSTGVPVPAHGGFGYNACCAEMMNIDNVVLRFRKVHRALGNALVAATHDPRLYAPSISAVSISGGGTGYSVGNIIAVNGGTPLQDPNGVVVGKARLRVSAVSAGVITAVEILSRGVYLAHPVGVTSTTAESGPGTGCVVTLTSVANTRNGVNNPKIDCLDISECTRAPLPSYKSVTAPDGITGTTVQIGAAFNMEVRIAGTKPGGPFFDMFNVQGGFLDFYVEGLLYTPLGYGFAAAGAGTIFQQSAGSVRSDFGMRAVTVRGTSKNAGPVRFSGSMSGGVTYFLNGGIPTPGPEDCVFDITILDPAGKTAVTSLPIVASGSTYVNTYTYPLQVSLSSLVDVAVTVKRGTGDSFTSVPNFGPGNSFVVPAKGEFRLFYSTAPTWSFAVAPNIYEPGFLLLAGSVAGVPGTVLRNTGRVTVKGSGGPAVALYNSSDNNLDLTVIDPGLTYGSQYALTLAQELNESGNGSTRNVIDLSVSDTRSPSQMIADVLENDVRSTGNSFMLARANGTPVANLTTGSTARWTTSAGSFDRIGFVTEQTAYRSTLALDAWTAYTPSAAATVGALGANTPTGRYRKVGRTVEVQIALDVTANGTGSTNIVMSLPFAAAGHRFVLHGMDQGNTQKALNGSIIPNSGFVTITNYDNTYPAFSGSFLVLNGTYEAAA